MKAGNKRFQVLTVLAVAFVLSMSTVAPAFSSGYLTGYQGPKPYFYGVKYQGTEYTSWDYGSASYHEFSDRFKFDVDGYTTGKPNIMGEETSIFVPEQALGNNPWWLPTNWNDGLQYINNPRHVYTWEIGSSTYQMEECLMRWYVTFDCEWDSNEYYVNEAISQMGTDVYIDAQVWMKIDLTPTWYFEGAEMCYFAIAKIVPAKDVSYRLKMDGSNDYGTDFRNGISVHPYSTSSVVQMYYEPWGGERAEKTVYDYNGKVLNPDLFTDEVYVHLDLNNFGVMSYKDLGFFKHIKADSATWALDVTVFVIGEWKVQDVDEIPELYGRLTQGYADLFDLINGIGEFLTSPFGLVVLLIIGAIVIFVFAPQLFAILFSSIGGKKSKGVNPIILIILAVIFVVFILPWLLRMLGVT